MNLPSLACLSNSHPAADRDRCRSTVTISIGANEKESNVWSLSIGPAVLPWVPVGQGHSSSCPKKTILLAKFSGFLF